MYNLLINFLLTVFIIVSLLLVLVVLMQRPRSEGLGTAFASDTISSTFGGAASGVLVKFTTWMGGLFFLLTILLAYLYSHQYSNTTVIGQARQSPAQKQVPAATPATAATAPIPAQALPTKSDPSSKVALPVAEPNMAAPALGAGDLPTATPPVTSSVPAASPAATPVAAPVDPAPTPVVVPTPNVQPTVATVPAPGPTIAAPPSLDAAPVVAPSAAPSATPVGPDTVAPVNTGKTVVPAPTPLPAATAAAEATPAPTPVATPADVPAATPAPAAQ